MRARKRHRRASNDDVTHCNDADNHGEPPQDDHEFRRSSSSNDLDKDGYVQVKLAEIRDKVQCPICLGIIRNARAVMECLHRFCQECVAKYMLLRSTECPACHTHCGGNSLRADPIYDALIEAFYPDVSKSKELAFHEEKMTCKKQLQSSVTHSFQPETKAQGRDRRAAKASMAVFVRRSRDPEALGALADINDAHPVIVAEDLTRDSSEKATNSDTDLVASLHNMFAPAPTPLVEHDLNASLPSNGVNFSMSELRLEDEVMVIGTTIECAVVAEQNRPEETVDMATGVTGPVLTLEGGNRVMIEDDPASISIQKSTVGESEIVDASSPGSASDEMIDPAANPLVNPMPTVPLNQPLATFLMPKSTNQIDVEAVLDPPMIHTQDINVSIGTTLERAKEVLHSKAASSANTSSESGLTSIFTDKMVNAKWTELRAAISQLSLTHQLRRRLKLC